MAENVWIVLCVNRTKCNSNVFSRFLIWHARFSREKIISEKRRICYEVFATSVIALIVLQEATCVSLKIVLGRQQSTTPRENIALTSYQIGKEKSFLFCSLGCCFIFRTGKRKHDAIAWCRHIFAKRLRLPPRTVDTLSCAIQREITVKIYHCQWSCMPIRQTSMHTGDSFFCYTSHMCHLSYST